MGGQNTNGSGLYNPFQRRHPLKGAPLFITPSFPNQSNFLLSESNKMSQLG